jgi:hypothetical protein
MDSKLDVDDVLRRRFWLKTNLEWFISEVIFHKEMKSYFAKNNKQKLWNYGESQGKVRIYNETTD